MAVYSMTGFGSATHGLSAPPGGQAADSPLPTDRIGVDIRSVNSRFLDLTLKLPDDLRAYESALRDLLTAKLKRGKVELRLSVDHTGQAAPGVPTPKLMQQLVGVQDQVRAWFPQARELSVADVLRMAGSEPRSHIDWAQTLVPLAEAALTQLMSAREREGAKLVAMLRDRTAQLRQLAKDAAPLIPQLVEQQRQRFLDRWKEAMALADGAVAPEAAHDRALTEATAFAIRIDVAEELTRLASHLDEIDRLLARGGELGKRMEFLIQELHREANTLGSKSATLELTRISVDMKVLIEQMREQVQNIE